MNALVYHGPGSKSWDDVAKPQIAADTDAIVRLDSETGALKVVLARAA